MINFYRLYDYGGSNILPSSRRDPRRTIRSIINNQLANVFGLGYGDRMNANLLFLNTATDERIVFIPDYGKDLVF